MGARQQDDSKHDGSTIGRSTQDARRLGVDPIVYPVAAHQVNARIITDDNFVRGHVVSVFLLREGVVRGGGGA